MQSGCHPMNSKVIDCRYGLVGFAVRVGRILLLPIFVMFLFSSCTQETQNRISRGVQNWTGTDGVLDVLDGGKLLYRFIKIDKLSTAMATGGSDVSRPYRFGYGYMDRNFNLKKDEGEKKVHFEFSDYSTNYVFYENPD